MAARVAGTLRAGSVRRPVQARRPAAWCCGSRSIGRDRQRRLKTASASRTVRHVSRDLSACSTSRMSCRRAYTLEVSSPGLDRPLRGADDYRRFAGRRAKVVMREKVDGQAFFKGHLRGRGRRRRADRGRRRQAAPRAARDHHAREPGSGILENEGHVESVAADHRGARQGKRHRARRRHQRHRGSGRTAARKCYKTTRT